MPQWMYCWRCGTEMPMLDDEEWERVAATFARAKDTMFGEALAMYKAITGFDETNPNALWHHKTSLFGPPCANCGKPLRTPAATRCVECGTDR